MAPSTLPPLPPLPVGQISPPYVDGDGAWHQGGLTLTPEVNRVVDEFLSRLEEAAHGSTGDSSGDSSETAGIRSRLRELARDIPGVRFEDPAHELEPADRIKQELAERLAAENGLDPLRALREIPDAIRYTVSVPTGDYTADVRELQSRLAAAGYEPVELRNGWLDGGEDRTGITARWREPETGVIFGVEYHTPESWQAQAARNAFEHANDQQIPQGERESPAPPRGEHLRPVETPRGVEEITDVR
ncbi:hypothetical protein FNH05_34645 [Amycolatopsis rhizosphaerae]|uniref:Uncharacterized protein n=2 Tax=Amycolatopsis rhizosphaerae TaxID=2053003 RepID=A0A558A738_9PSEU|nr:hypothetical protein FNH05_34645 [Amycolatopsis rhizosphaerae]